MTEITEEMIEMKKQKFLDAVSAASNARTIPTPAVNFEGCLQEREGTLAHIHLDQYTICVSKRQLTVLNFDDIYNTATHEVAHIFDATHGPKFQKAHADIRIDAWTPPGGVFIMRGGKWTNKRNDKKKPKVDKLRCNLPLCRKDVILEQCKFCGDFYCKDHITPTIPGTAKEIRFGEGGHPCPEYLTFKTEEDRKKNEAFDEALNRMKPLRKEPSGSELAPKRPKWLWFLIIGLLFLLLLAYLKMNWKF